MKRKYLILALGAVAVVVLVFLVVKIKEQNVANQVNSNQTAMLTVRLGLSTQPSNGLLWVAVDKNFFKEEGLNVEVSEFTAGKLALQAMLGGSLDLVTPAEFPVALTTLNGEKLSILTAVNETKGGFPMIFRKNGNEIFNTSTYFLKKIKIGTVIGGGPEFFTQDFLKKYQVKPGQYEIIGMKPEDLPIALANGSVDGIAIFEPFTNFAVKQAGENNLFVIYDKDLYSETIVLTAKSDWARSHSEEVTRFIRALKKSSLYIKNNPELAISSVAFHTKLDLETLKNIWLSFTYELGLDKRLISNMEAEATWAKETGKIRNVSNVLNFEQLFLSEPLKNIFPASLNL